MARQKTDSLERLLHALLSQGAQDPTYKNLAHASGLSSRTVAGLMRELRDKGLVRTSPAEFGPGWGMVLSVALGTETCRAGLVDANGRLHAAFEDEPLKGQIKLPPAQLLGRLRTAVERVLSIAAKDPGLAPKGRLPLLGLATAWACPVRGSKRSAGTILHSDWERDRRTLPEAVAAATGFPADRVHVLNGANAHMLAVAFDEGRRQALRGDEGSPRIALLLRIGGGIGASTMIITPHKRARLNFIDSVLIGGSRSLAGELAHLPVEPSIVDELNETASWLDGLYPLSKEWRCSCGRSEHLEALAGGAAWERRMEGSEIDVKSLLAGLDRYTPEEIDRAILDFEDPRVSYALEDMGRLIGRSLASPILLLDPHVLYLSGSYAVDPVVKGIVAERENWRHVFGDGLTVKRIMDPDARFLGVRGAALAVLRGLVYRRFGDWLSDPNLGAHLVFEKSLR